MDDETRCPSSIFFMHRNLIIIAHLYPLQSIIGRECTNYLHTSKIKTGCTRVWECATPMTPLLKGKVQWRKVYQVKKTHHFVFQKCGLIFFFEKSKKFKNRS